MVEQAYHFSIYFVYCLELEKKKKPTTSNWEIKCFSNIFRDQDLPTSNQSLRILSNLAAAGAIQSCRLLDEILCVLLDFTGIIISLKSLELNDLIAKVYWGWISLGNQQSFHLQICMPVLQWYKVLDIWIVYEWILVDYIIVISRVYKLCSIFISFFCASSRYH